MAKTKAPKTRKGELETWKKRWSAAEDAKEAWEKRERVKLCYNYWQGEQRVNVNDSWGLPKAIVNKIHPEVRNAIPNLYFYRPFARIVPKPELADTPGTQLQEATQLIQDTTNHLIRLERVRFRPSTFLGLKESFWAMGVVEVGYSACFMDDPGAPRPPLREREDTDIGPDRKLSQKQIDEMTPEEIDAELERLQGQVKSEQFFVKHIPSKQVFMSSSDKPILEDNDWVGYWEDVPLEDVKQAGKNGTYEHTENLKAHGMSGDEDDESYRHARERYENDMRMGNVDRVRLFKVWDLRDMRKKVWAEGHEHFLMDKPFKRCPLKFLRFDIDPYHFYPKPPISLKLGPQDEYNESREFIRKTRIGIVPRYTVDEDAVDDEEMQKLEKGIHQTWIKRKAGTVNPIEPVNQPSYSENAITSLTLSDKEFKDVGGVGGDPQVAKTKTATQAKIAEVKEQVQEGFDRQTVADWLGEIAEELVMLAIENMLLDEWVQVNIAPDSPAFMQEAQFVAKAHRNVNAKMLQAAASGTEFDLDIDIESLSPVTEEERFQKLMQAISFLGNPQFLQVFAVAPQLLKMVLKYMGIRNSEEQGAILGALQQLVQIQMAQAQMGVKPGPGVSPQPGGAQPGQPSPADQAGTNGGPQPGGPTGPGASRPQ